MVIEVLGRIITEKDKEISNLNETISKLNKKIDAFTQYIEVFEDGYKNKSSNLSV
jgi:peptidoglycan hydrolase CwlO-like protein